MALRGQGGNGGPQGGNTVDHRRGAGFIRKRHSREVLNLVDI